MKALKLRAIDAQDLQVISSYLQDAVTVPADLAYQPKQHRFAAMFNRYCWEAAERDRSNLPDDMKCLRVRTGIHFDGVLKVDSQNIPKRMKNAPMELLAIDCEPEPDGAALILLIFAGGGIIRLHAECIDCHLSDVTEPWPARCRPEHPSVENI